MHCLHLYIKLTKYESKVNIKLSLVYFQGFKFFFLNNVVFYDLDQVAK